MRFEFAAPARIVFARGALAEAAPAARALGTRALVVLGAPSGRESSLLAALAAQGVDAAVLAVRGEPDIALVRQGVGQARQHNSDLVVGFGGGSAIDTAKAVAILLTNGGDPLDYLEVIGQGRPLIHPALPCIAIPTTAGTGAEVTRNAVLASPEHRVKVSLRSAHILPRLAIVDPALTDSLPPAVTASTGLDALTQLIEPFVSVRANPISDGFCREGMPRAARALPVAHSRGDPTARDDMALASLLGGLALANAGLGAVHGIASVIGGRYAAAHGALCARLLPEVMSVNIAVLRRRLPGSPALERYDEVARLLCADEAAVATDGVAWVRTLCTRLSITPLSAYGVTAADIPHLVEKSLLASSSKANPIPLAADEMHQVIELAL